MRNLIVILLLIVHGVFLHSQERYVTTTAAGGGDGLTEATAWTLTEAVSFDTTGLIVNVKAGNYGNTQTSAWEANTHLRGYLNTAGDISTTNAPSYVYPAALDVNAMPTITGSVLTAGTGMNISTDAVTVENFQFTNMLIGLIMSGTNNKAINVLSHTLGTQVGAEIYQGTGIRMIGQQALVQNCTVVNTGAEGIVIGGGAAGAVVEYSHVYSDKIEADNGMDYYILITGLSNNNTVRFCTVNRFNETAAGRHGLVIKNGGNGNTFRDCVANDVNVEVNFTNVFNNTFRDIEVNGTWSAGDSDVCAKIRIANGAHDNKFINFVFNDVYGAIAFADWDDGADPAGAGTNSAIEFGGGNDNVIINPIVKNSRYVIFFEEFEALSTADDNVIIGGTFVNVDFLARVRMANSGTRFVNCIFDDITTFQDATVVLNTNTIFENINVTNSFAATIIDNYVESDITTLAVPFADAANSDFTLTSNLMDIGQNASLIDSQALFDFDMSTRNNPYSLGAYEFGGVASSGSTSVEVLKRLLID